jgi:hypothetical protein
VTDTPQGASEDLLARVIAAVGEQERRQMFDEVAQQLADPAAAGRAAGWLLRTAAVFLAGADLDTTPELRQVTRDIAETLAVLAGPVRGLFARLDVDDADLGQTADALETAAGGMRALDVTADRP